MLSRAPRCDNVRRGEQNTRLPSGLGDCALHVRADGWRQSHIPATDRGRAAFHAANVDTARGAVVRDLPPGSYVATWVLIDANRDTRTLRTQFVDER
jgi:hypothetical protein